MWANQDPRTSQWRRKFNQELKEELNIVTVNGFIKSQRTRTCYVA
jgi:hypothetical protein